MSDRLEDLKRMADGWKSSGVWSLAVDIMEWAVDSLVSMEGWKSMFGKYSRKTR